MSWPLVSAIVLALGLAGAFAWYERSRPPAKVLALVGTLAALAALGRVAFAALPDIKPTTDIVMITGYTLGAAPGFVVGAVAPLVSNVFLAEGAWTPWQMAGWGLVGLLGAGLGRLTARRLGRLPLGVSCALMAIVFGAVMNLYTWTLTGTHTLAGYLTVGGAALPFDLAHATGNLLFALAFGPGLVRALTRFRRRLEVTWLPAPARLPGALVVLALALAAGPALRAASVAPAHAAPQAPARAAAHVPARAAAHVPARAAAHVPARAAAHVPARAAAVDPAIARALAYLTRAQNPDGGFGGTIGSSSTQLITAWAAMGLASAGRPVGSVRRGRHSPLDFMLAGAGSMRDSGDLERTILALRAAGASPRRAAGRDLVAALRRQRSPDGSFAGQVNTTAFAVLALRAGGLAAADPAVAAAVRWITRQQNADGGFNFAVRGGPSGIDDTAAPLQALVAAGRRGPAVGRAAAYLAAHQNPDGGFPLSSGSGSNAQSTAWAMQAFVAAGRDPDRVRRAGSRSPAAYLRSLVAPDGSMRYSRTSRQTPVWVTAQALTALARVPFPVSPPRVAPRRGRARRARGRAAGARNGPRPGSGGARRAPAAGSHGAPRASAPGVGTLAPRGGAGAHVLALARAAGVLAGLVLGSLGAR